MSTTASYKDVIKDIQDFYTENSVNAYAPTVDKTLKFKPLSVSQMKKFIELQVKASKEENQGLPTVDAAKELTQCLVDNFLGPDDYELGTNLTILDRDCIIAQLRASNNPMIDIPDKENDSYEASIAHVLTNFKDNKLSADCLSREKVFKFKSGKLKLKLRLPSLSLDTYINDFYRKDLEPFLKQGKKSLKNNLEKILSQTIFVELSKYIEYIEITKNTKSTLITFDNDQTLKNNLKILEGLPSSLIVEINSFVRNIKDYKDTALFYVDKDGNQKSLTIDINLFTTI